LAGGGRCGRRLVLTLGGGRINHKGAKVNTREKKLGKTRTPHERVRLFVKGNRGRPRGALECSSGGRVKPIQKKVTKKQQKRESPFRVRRKTPID